MRDTRKGKGGGARELNGRWRHCIATQAAPVKPERPSAAFLGHLLLRVAVTLPHIAVVALIFGKV